MTINAPDFSKISTEIRLFFQRHAILCAIGAGAFVFAAGAFIFWYEVFSGFAEPVQFIYSAF